MANNYLEFSEVLPLLTDPEIEWLQQQLEMVYVFDGKEYGEVGVARFAQGYRRPMDRLPSLSGYARLRR